jgi:murein DD-endopeptidase MepM/ murein hydrolase activator NlpD
MITRKTFIQLVSGAIYVLIVISAGLYGYFSLKHLKVRPIAELPTKKEVEEKYVSAGPLNKTLEINQGDTISSVLEHAGVATDQATSIIETLTPIFNPRELRPEHELHVTYTISKEDSQKKDLLQLYLKIAIDLDIVIKRDDKGHFRAKKIQKKLVREHRLFEGKIEESLYTDANKRGAHPKILADMIAVFSYDIDFQRGIQQGDTYGLYYSVYKDPKGLQEKPGELLFAYLNCSGRIFKVYRFKDKNGHSQYFNEKGENVKKGLMRTPIDGARLTSGFGKRHHPILGYTRMHKGVDFAAPIGTPVMAAGDGRIKEVKSLFGSYGNYVLIEHSRLFSTAYAHLCRFARGLKVGQPIRQGQIIGYVGCTGLSSGPHLHYELIKEGKQINPKLIQMLPLGKLKDKEMQNFMLLKTNVDQEYASVLFQRNNPLKEIKQTKDPLEEKRENPTKENTKT